MSSWNLPNLNNNSLTTAGQQVAMQQQQPQQPGAAPQPAPPQTTQPSAPQQQPAQQGGLPQTGLQQQLDALNAYYSGVQGQRRDRMNPGGFNVRQFQFEQAQLGGDTELDQNDEVGGSSLDAMARNLAQRWGLPIGRGRIMDEQGNFLMSPQQLADASGGSLTLGEAAASMNYLSDAVTRFQNEKQQKKGIAALQAGLGQVQSRGRGSLASMMSGYYEGLADLYANQEYEAADFSYFIQKEYLDIQQEMQRRAEKMAKKQGVSNFVAGAAITVASIYTGNLAGVAAGGSMMYGGGSQAGWF